MTGYELPGLEPGRTVHVGWSQPLRSFFVHVHGPSFDRTGPEVRLGDEPYQLHDVADLRTAVARYAALTPEIEALLVSDKDAGGQALGSASGAADA